MSGSPNEQLAATILDEYKLANETQLENLIIQYMAQSYILKRPEVRPSLTLKPKQSHHFIKRTYTVEIYDRGEELLLRSQVARTRKDAHLNLLCQAAERCRKEYLSFVRPPSTEPGCFDVFVLDSGDANTALQDVPTYWSPYETNPYDCYPPHRDLYIKIIDRLYSGARDLEFRCLKLVMRSYLDIPRPDRQAGPSRHQMTLYSEKDNEAVDEDVGNFEAHVHKALTNWACTAHEHCPLTEHHRKQLEASTAQLLSAAKVPKRLKACQEPTKNLWKLFVEEDFPRLMRAALIKVDAS